MITSKLKSASDSWKLSYEDAINMMKAELEEARDDQIECSQGYCVACALSKSSLVNGNEISIK